MKKLIFIILLILVTISHSYALRFEVNPIDIQTMGLDWVEDNHNNLTNTGTNTHPQVDTHIADGTIHFTEGSIDHGSISGLSDDDHTLYILENGTRAFTGNQSFGDFNITNVGDIALDTISSAAGTSISVTLGTDAGDDFIVDNFVYFEGDNKRVGIGTNTPTAKVEITGDGHLLTLTGGTLPDDGSEHWSHFTGTFPSTPTGTLMGAFNELTSTGTHNQDIQGFTAFLTAGNTGTGIKSAFKASSQVAGTGAEIMKSGTPRGNIGFEFNSIGDTTGNNYGVAGFVRKGDISIGGLFRAGYTESHGANIKSGATYIGTVGIARNTTNGGGRNIGGYFSLDQSDGNPVFESAALIADNDDATVPIFLARDNGIKVFSIIDGGRVGINEISPDAMLEIATNSSTEEGVKVKGSANQKGSLLLLTDSSDNTYITSGDGLTNSEFRGNDQGVDIDWVWEGNSSAGLFFDAANIRFGIGTETPTSGLQMGNDKLIALDTNSNITASTNQAQGQGALTAQVNEISICANTDDTVTLPSAITGVEIEIINNGAETLQIFPASGDNVGLGVNISEELESNERVKFVAYDNTNWAKESTTEIIHAEIHDEDNTDSFIINDAGGDFHSYHTNGLVAGDLADWVFDAGGAGTSHAIASITDGTPSGTDIAVTTGDNHGLAVGDIISQTNLSDANYVGVFVVKDINSDTTYEVAAVFNLTGTGTMDQAATLEADPVAAGVYSFAYYISAKLTGNNETFDFQLYREAAAVVGSKVRRKFGAVNDFGSCAGGGIVSIGSGDKISLAISNEDSAANIILRNITLVLIRL